MSRKDPLRYFRIEARGIVDSLEAGLLASKQGGTDIHELFRLAHTLKGAARVVQQTTMADLSHTLEDVLAHHRETGEALSAQETAELLMLVDGLRRALPANQQEPEASGTPQADARDPAVLRIPLDEMDGLAAAVLEAQVHAHFLKSSLSGLTELSRQARALQEQVSSSPTSGLAPRLRAGLDELSLRIEEHSRPFAHAFAQLERELADVAERAAELRLVDISVLLPELERAAAEAARVSGRQVAFRAEALRVGIDGHVLSALRGALVHLVNNAVVHGIEEPGERARRGKPACGTVRLCVERRGARVAVSVEDDGRGIDREAVMRAAEARGLVARADASLRPETLIFEPGLTTAPELSSLSGRGVGLDAVRRAIELCKGSVQALAPAGGGTRFEIVVPTSLTAVRALSVSALGRSCLVPLDSVAATLRLTEEQVVGVGTDTSIVHGKANVPFRRLALALEPSLSSSPARVGVLLRTRRGQLMLGVDALGGTRDVIVHPLPAAAGSCPFAYGAAFDAFGDPELILDPDGLEALEAELRAPPVGSARKPILVVDDSLTTRMLEQSILETAGYTVELASCAEEGLDKLRAGCFGLVVVDVEMPGMNGYEFTRVLRTMPACSALPVIMVSSLSSEESRVRGRAAGISAYMVKGEFDQGRFLRTVAELLA